MHCIRLPGNPYVLTAGFSPDGETLYVVGEALAINLWELLIYFWPEIGGGIVALAATTFLLVLWHVRRTPRIPGEPHCRRCNYCLKNAVSNRCPECFAPIKRPRLGRTLRRRLLPTGAPAATAALLYACAWIAGFPRAGWVGAWFNWRSFDLKNFALARGVNLSAWERPVCNIYVVDVISGTVKHIFETTYAAWPYGFNITVTPDGSGLLAPMPDGLAIIEAETGTVRRLLPGPLNSSTGRSCWQQIAGFGDDGKTAYVVMLDEAADRTKLLRWDMETNETSPMLELPCDTAAILGGQLEKLPHRLYRVPGQTPRFLEMQSSLGVRNNGADPSRNPQARYHIFGGDGEHLFSVDMTAESVSASGPGLSSDGRRAFFSNHVRRTVSAYVLAAGDIDVGYELRDPRMRYNGNSQAQIGRMVVPGSQGYVVADLDTAEWLGSFSIPPRDGTFFGLYVAPNGDFFAVHGRLDPMANPTNIDHCLFVFDMRDLADTAGAD